MAFTREFVRTAAKQSGVELPKELEDALMQEHISEKEEHSRQKIQEALKNHKPEPIKVEDSEEYKALKKQFEDFKTEQTEKETKAAKAKAVREVLTSAGLSGKALEMASKLFDAKSLELDESGRAKDFDNLVSAAKTEYADVIYIPTDNTMAQNTEAINNITLPAGTPIIAGEEGICKGCGVATLSISYYDIGKKAGEMAYDILVNGADITTMKIETAPNVTKEYNKDICDQLGVKIPDDYKAIEAE